MNAHAPPYPSTTVVVRTEGYTYDTTCGRCLPSKGRSLSHMPKPEIVRFATNTTTTHLLAGCSVVEEEGGAGVLSQPASSWNEPNILVANMAPMGPPTNIPPAAMAPFRNASSTCEGGARVSVREGHTAGQPGDSFARGRI
jgi:hypothetical protein